MKTKKQTVSVIYEVTFNENTRNGKRKVYEAGKAYRFRTQSPTNHTGDMFDAAFVAIHRLFGYIKKGAFVNFLNINNPVIIKEKEA